VYLKSHTPPRLILLDVMMPVMDGYEFRIEQQRESGPSPTSRSWVLTAGSMGERVAEMGVTAHMRKAGRSRSPAQRSRAPHRSQPGPSAAPADHCARIERLLQRTARAPTDARGG